ncbi:MAG: DNA glycosylase [Clostridia bacterium]|nr:DNA glycosylase [Clostridia bacterium]
MKKPFIKSENNGWLTVGGVGDFSVFRTFDCGQCFRFDPDSEPEFDNQVTGIAFGKSVSFADGADGELLIKSSPEDFESVWKKYLSLDTDYEKINSRIISSVGGAGGEHMKRAVQLSSGIRILRQDSWEALCSFIVSQNNNIPRIKKIIREMCLRYGEKVDGGNAFPTAKALADAGETAIFNMRTGFRAKYIYDAAKKVSSGELSLDAVRCAPTYEEAEKLLLSVSGVGPKVAACTLLFGFSRLEAFPVDVWIKRVIERRFPDGLDPKIFGEYAGIAQQYLFYCERYCN